MVSDDFWDLRIYQSIYPWIYLLNYLASISILLSSLSISVSLATYVPIYLFVHLYSLIWYRGTGGSILSIYNYYLIQVYSIRLISTPCIIFDAKLCHSIPFIVFYSFFCPILLGVETCCMQNGCTTLRPQSQTRQEIMLKLEGAACLKEATAVFVDDRHISHHRSSYLPWWADQGKG